MKILDIVHRYPSSKTLSRRGLCRIRSFVGTQGIVVLMTDLSALNDGASVTNAVEDVIESLYQEGKVVGEASFIEHYEKTGHSPPTFDLVRLKDSRPTWTTMSRADVMKMASCSSDELEEKSEANTRILEQADRLRFESDPFIDSPYPEASGTIQRRLEIMKGMISKEEITNLVTKRSSERELQSFLKNDLSIFAEVYASPPDDYICFSEFPIENGAVDIVVLSGRSKMDVILIELKGTDFNLSNSGHYNQFNHKITQAADQIMTRLRHVYENLGDFRKFVHQVRCDAERGKIRYNAFLGPYGYLEVDPNKDINIRTVIIGGRTVDDLKESKKRHDYEAHTVPPIRVESWDTWLRKLRRQ
jgi:hypothetical protein